MKAVVVTEEGISVQNVETPKPKENEVLVKVFACGLNRADLVVADGGAHGASGGPGTIVGMEFSGEVIELGSKVKDYSIGDRVMCSGSSAWAEYAVADHGRVIKIPNNNMDYLKASTYPIALATMHNAIVTAGNFTQGQSVLIQGASSGVGLMGLQISKYLGAKVVIGTSTKPDKFEKLKNDFDILSVQRNLKILKYLHRIVVLLYIHYLRKTIIIAAVIAIIVQTTKLLLARTSNKNNYYCRLVI